MNSGSPSSNFTTPPPLPPRPAEIYRNHGIAPSYGMYGNSIGYNAAGYGNAYGVGMYGGIYGNGIGGNYNVQHGYSNPESNFARLAEESSRGAFQSIESVVNAVSSVANMLSSTHNAVYSSFRAVIGVVEQLSKLKQQLATILFSLSIFKFMQRMWRYLLVLFRLKPANYASVEELAWSAISHPYGSELLDGPSAPVVKWPAIMFWIVAIGGPWLIYKTISQMVHLIEEKRKWATGVGAHYTAQMSSFEKIALYDFTAATNQELSFTKDDILRIAPKEEQPRVRGWLLASSQNGEHVGLVPINYVKIVGRKSMSPPLREQVDNLPTFEMSLKNVK